MSLFLQVTDGTTLMPPEVEPVNTSDGPICPVPEGIRPVMKKHRIEVSGTGDFPSRSLER
jgi:hypothetical protein